MAEADLTASDSRKLLRLADLPLFSPQKSAINSHRLVGFDSRDIRARPFNLLRTSLAKRMKENELRLVGMTSATPAAGKSYLSLNLASSLARISDQPVFLVDLDMRRASLAEEIGLDVEHGIESFLEGDISDLSRVGFRIEGSELGIFPTVRRGRNTAELLASERFAELVDIFRNRCDAATVLFDLPPAFANDDAMISLEHLDGYLLVVDSGKTTRKHVQDVLAVLHPTPCIGSILNRYNGGFADSYGYGYGGPDYGKYYDQS
jgi:Mrp family chromosome partitioning ATPase